jgi:hypothetical protein
MGELTIPLHELAHNAEKSGPSQYLSGLQRKANGHAFQSVAGHVMQLASLSSSKLNVAGEDHEESGPRRAEEAALGAEKAGSANYWREGEFLDAAGTGPADSYELRYDQILQFGLTLQFDGLAGLAKDSALDDFGYGDLRSIGLMRNALDLFYVDDMDAYATAGADALRIATAKALVDYRDKVVVAATNLQALMDALVEKHTHEQEDIFAGLSLDGPSEEPQEPVPKIMQLDYGKLQAELADDDAVKADLATLGQTFELLAATVRGADKKFGITGRNVSNERSVEMHAAASAQRHLRGLWKIGNQHAADLDKYWFKKYNLLTQAEFNSEMT